VTCWRGIASASITPYRQSAVKYFSWISISRVQALIVILLTLIAAGWPVEAATNTFNFRPTVLTNTGPVNPTNGAVTIRGASLTEGVVIIFDGIVANVSGTTGDNWGSVNFNPAGFMGLTGARFGVLSRTG
jgi:hypothetical protein